MNLKDSGDVAVVLRAAYLDNNPQHPAAVAAARRLAERTRKPLGSTGRPYVDPRQIEEETADG